MINRPNTLMSNQNYQIYNNQNAISSSITNNQIYVSGSNNIRQVSEQYVTPFYQQPNSLEINQYQYINRM